VEGSTQWAALLDFIKKPHTLDLQKHCINISDGFWDVRPFFRLKNQLRHFGSTNH
jgi:hypothetical protein